MIASESFLREFIRKNEIDPILGSDEINSEKYIEWFSEVKEKEFCGVLIKNYDINSAIIIFEDDLMQFYEKNMKE